MEPNELNGILYRLIIKGDNDYFVNTSGSMAIVSNRFYINGVLVTVAGQTTINITDGSTYIVTVDATGVVLDKEIIPAPAEVIV